MRDHARSRTVQLNETGGLREVPGSEAIEALRRTGLRESDAVQHVLAADVIEVPRPEGPKAAPPGRPFFGRADEQAELRAWLDSSANTVAMVIGVAGIGKSTLVARVLEGERRPTFARRVYAHDDPHGLLSSFADFLARQGRRRLKAVITRPAYDPVEAIAVLRTDLSGCIVAIDDLHTCPAADALLRPLVEDPVPAKILVASRVHPTFYERADVLRGRVAELTLAGGPRRHLVPAAAPRPARPAPPPGRRISDPRSGEGVLPPAARRGRATGGPRPGGGVLAVPIRRIGGGLPSDRGRRRRDGEGAPDGDWTGARRECARGRPRGGVAARPADGPARRDPGRDRGVTRPVRGGAGRPREDRRFGRRGGAVAGAHPSGPDPEPPRRVQGGPRSAGGGRRGRRPPELS